MTLAIELARSGEAAKSGPIGLAIILILCVVCYFLFKSMSKHLRRVREEFPGGKPPADDAVQQTAPPAQRPAAPPGQRPATPPAP